MNLDYPVEGYFSCEGGGVILEDMVSLVYFKYLVFYGIQLGWNNTIY